MIFPRRVVRHGDGILTESGTTMSVSCLPTLREPTEAENVGFDGVHKVCPELQGFDPDKRRCADVIGVTQPTSPQHLDQKAKAKLITDAVMRTSAKFMPLSARHN